MATKRPLKVGLTGGIGSGKSTVCNRFASLGVPIIDADRIAHRATRSGGRAYEKVRDLFGPGAVGPDGELRRELMRDRVFQDPDLRRQLEDIIHPIVFEEMRREVGTVHAPYCIVCIPLILETRYRGFVDRLLVVDAPERLQVERVMRRDGVDAESVERIMKNQYPRETRLAAADDLIQNDRDEDYLGEQVNRLHEAYLELAREHVESSS